MSLRHGRHLRDKVTKTMGGGESPGCIHRGRGRDDSGPALRVSNIYKLGEGVQNILRSGIFMAVVEDGGLYARLRAVGSHGGH